MFADIFFDRGDMSVFLGVCEIGFRDIGGVENRFCGEKKKVSQNGNLLIGDRESDGRLGFVEMREKFFDESDGCLRLFIAAADFFLFPFEAAFDGGDIGENQLGVDDFDIADRID